MTRSFRFAFPERFVVGTIGAPGERTFFLQARDAGRLTSVKAEKQQVAALAESLDKILDDLTRIVDDPSVVPAHVERAADLDPLDVPLDEEFRVGTMTIAWDPRQSAVVIELFSVERDDTEETESQGSLADMLEENVEKAAARLTVSMTPQQARQFATRANAVVGAGRPACPFCGQPVGAEGHICPRANGYLPGQFA